MYTPYVVLMQIGIEAAIIDIMTSSSGGSDNTCKDNRKREEVRNKR